MLISTLSVKHFYINGSFYITGCDKGKPKQMDGTRHFMRDAQEAVYHFSGYTSILRKNITVIP